MIAAATFWLPMRFLRIVSPVGALFTALPGTLAHKYPTQDIVNEAQNNKRDVRAGGKCGLAGGNSTCTVDLCCSPGGICGTGKPFCASPDCQLNFGPGCDGNRMPFIGRDTSEVLRPLFGNVPYDVAVSTCKLKGKIALTFDDGPNTFTGDLLDILKKNKAKATFMVVGTNGGKGQIENPETPFPGIIRRMHEEGHQIGSHSWSHENLALISPQQRRDQIIRNEIALVDILGFFPTYLRTPYSSWNDDVLADLKKLGYHNLNFNLDTQDWEDNYQVARDIFASNLSQHSPADSSFIVVAHDIREQTVHGYVQYMIDEAKKYNYELVTVGDCLADPPNNWYRDSTSGQPFGGTPEQPSIAMASSSASASFSTHQSTAESVLLSTKASTAASAQGVSTTAPASGPELGTDTGAGTGTGIGDKPKSSTGSNQIPPTTAATTPKPNFAEHNIPNSIRVIFLMALVMLIKL